MSRAEQSGFVAAEWLIAQEDGPLTPEQQADFDAWLNASEGNKAAYWRLQFGWEQADVISGSRAHFDESASKSNHRIKMRFWLPAAVAASVIVAFGIQQYSGEWESLLPSRNGEPVRMATRTYSTGVGARDLVGLPDGSHIQLNTQSTLRAGLSRGRREVWLDKGEAFFDVAHREDRPFVVHAGDKQVTVLGTKFSVRRDGHRVMVAVLEGRVQLTELNGKRTRSSVIASGDIAIAQDGATLVTAGSEEKVQHALSWREGMLSFDQEPLSAIAAEFNRYNTRKLTLDGASVGAIRITGTFPSDKPDAFARLLRQAYGLEVEESEDGIRVSP